jgi:HEAT repeat protein
MKNIKIIFIFLFIAPLISEGLLFAQQKQNSKKIPPSIISEVRVQIEKLYSDDAADRVLAAMLLGEMGEKATPAIPFLIDILSDTKSVIIQSETKNIVASTSPDREALTALVNIGKPAVQPLIAVVKDKNITVRKNAVEALGEIKDTRALDILIVSMKDENPDIRRNAAEALGKIRDIRAIDALTIALKDKKSSVQQSANAAIQNTLQQLKANRAIEPLIALLNHDEPAIRRFAIEALGGIPDPRVPDHLILALKDTNADVRETAAESLRKTGAPAVEALIKTLRENDINTRVIAIRILGDIKDTRSIEPLIDVLEFKSRNPVPEEAQLRYEAAKALGKMKTISAIQPLIVTLGDTDPHVRESAAESLREIGVPSVQYLIESLEDENINIRVGAVMLLGDLRDTRAIEPLIDMMATDFFKKSWMLRSEVAKALGKIGDPFAIQPLQKLSNDRDSYVREIAISALDEIEKKASGK